MLPFSLKLDTFLRQNTLRLIRVLDLTHLSDEIGRIIRSTRHKSQS